MFPLAADENFNWAILRGVERRVGPLDCVRAQEAGLIHVPDEEVLAWAAQLGRVLLTHDSRTVPPIAYQRIADGLSMPGVIIVRTRLDIGTAVRRLSVIVETARVIDYVDTVQQL